MAALASQSAQNFAEVLLRRARLAAVRPHLRIAGVLPDPHRTRHPRRQCPRDRGADRAASRDRRVRRRVPAQGPLPARCVEAAGALPADRHFGRAPVAIGHCAATRLPRPGCAARGGRLHAAFALPAMLPGAGRRVGFFPGSTIGNFTPDEALHFLQGAGQVLRGGALLLGADLMKEPAVLHAAYNDAQGVTAAFNLNLLARANRELGARFELDALRAQRLLQRAGATHRDAPGQPATPEDRAGRRMLRVRGRRDACIPRTRTNSPSTACAGWRCARVSGRGRYGPTPTAVQRPLAARTRLMPRGRACEGSFLNLHVGPLALRSGRNPP